MKIKITKHLVVLGILLLIAVIVIYLSGKRKDSRNHLPLDLGMKLVYVAPGSFQMGSNDGDSDEKPVHCVTITNGYWIGKYEVTQKEYQTVMGTNPSYFKRSNKPVEMVSWNDATKFCQKLTECERTAGRLASDCEYRLPTEAEWEYAARGGNKSRGYKYSGSNNIDSVAWYFNNSGDLLNDSDWLLYRSKDKTPHSRHFVKFIDKNNNRTHEIGTKSVNELGIHDMSGNVYEWCNDWYGNNYSKGNATDPAGASSGTHRVFRGGSWYYRSLGCRVSERYYNRPSNSYSHMGFRVVRTTSKDKK